MFGNGLSCGVEVFGNGVWSHCLQCNQGDDRPSCRVGNGLENISSHGGVALNYFLIIGRYFSLLSIIAQKTIAINANMMGRPDGAMVMLVSSIPVRTGEITMAPSALVLPGINNKPPRISMAPTSGMSQPISANAIPTLTIFSGRSLGTG